MQCKWCTGSPAELLAAAGELTTLAGEALEVVSGRRFRPCTHRVVAAPATRYSVVFHLRMRRDAVLDSVRLRHPPHLPRLRLDSRGFCRHSRLCAGRRGISRSRLASTERRGLLARQVTTVELKLRGAQAKNRSRSRPLRAGIVTEKSRLSKLNACLGSLERRLCASL